MELARRIETFAGIGLVALVVAGCVLVLAPFVSAILWAAVICFTTWPVYERVERLCGHRRTLASSIMTVLLIVVTVAPFLLAASTLDTTVENLGARVQAMLAGGLPPPPDWIGQVPVVGDYARDYWTSLVTDNAKGQSFVKMMLSRTTAWLLRRAMDLGIGVVHLCISVFIAFFFYRHGENLVGRVGELGRRVFGEYSKHLIAVVGRTVRGVVYAIIGTAIAQGIMAAIGFAIAGVPWAVPLGLLTFLFSLIPFGAPLVWIGATLWLLAHGSIGWAIFMTVWGFFGISGIDNFIRPYLISRGAKLPFVIVFLGAIGGILVFGLIGLFLGPTLLAVGYTLMQEFVRRGHAAHHPAHTAGAGPVAPPPAPP